MLIKIIISVVLVLSIGTPAGADDGGRMKIDPFGYFNIYSKENMERKAGAGRDAYRKHYQKGPDRHNQRNGAAGRKPSSAGHAAKDGPASHFRGRSINGDRIMNGRPERWRMNGSPFSGSSPVAPEPSSTILFLSGIAVLFGFRKRHKKQT